MATIREVAKWILYHAGEAGDCITHLKLQKLCYYAEAWHLALHGKPLTGESFEAWVHGPVSRTLYRTYAAHRHNPLPIPTSEPRLEDAVERHLEDVLDAYSHFSAWDLERMTHAEEPWLAARAGLAPTEEGTTVIRPEDMTRYYRARLERNAKA